MRDPRKHRWKIVQFVARQLPPCQTITRLISDARDQRPSIKDWLTIRAHQTVCAFCTRFDHQVACIDHALKYSATRPEHQFGDHRSLSETARERIRSRLKSGD